MAFVDSLSDKINEVNCIYPKSLERLSNINYCLGQGRDACPQLRISKYWSFRKKRRKNHPTKYNLPILMKQLIFKIEDTLHVDAEEVEEELLWLCIHTLKTCLLTPIALQNFSTSSSSSLLCSFHPNFSAKPNIFSFCSAVNFVRNRFFPHLSAAPVDSTTTGRLPPLPPSP
ncbi:hypothetical protein SCA6_003860 [Theobroma cacao]